MSIAQPATVLGISWSPSPRLSNRPQFCALGETKGKGIKGRPWGPSLREGSLQIGMAIDRDLVCRKCELAIPHPVYIFPSLYQVLYAAKISELSPSAYPPITTPPIINAAELASSSLIPPNREIPSLPFVFFPCPPPTHNIALYAHTSSPFRVHTTPTTRCHTKALYGRLSQEWTSKRPRKPYHLQHGNSSFRAENKR